MMCTSKVTLALLCLLGPALAAPVEPSPLPIKARSEIVVGATLKAVVKPAEGYVSASLFRSPSPSVTIANGKVRTTTTPSKAAKYIAGSYFTDWDTVTPEKINYTAFDLLHYAFGIPTSSGGISFSDDGSTSRLTRLVTLGHKAGKKVVLSVGGWTDSTYFSTIVSTSSGRTKFANNLQSLIKKYNLDGIDIDWEYPGSEGADGNKVSSADTTNLLSFLKTFRSTVGTTKLITMAVSLQTWSGSDGKPMKDVSKYATYLDRILLMNYDVFQASSSPGPNSPLSAPCGTVQPGINAEGAIKAWNKAGIPLSKLMLGLPSYGYVSKSSATKLIHRRKRSLSLGEAFVQTKLRRGRPGMSKRDILLCPNNHGGVGCQGEFNASKSTSSPALKVPGQLKVAGDILGRYVGTQIPFNQLISAGALVKASNGTYIGHSGYTRRWDNCSSTPFLTNPAAGIVVTYDDGQSIKLKAQYAASKGLAGILFWDLASDTSNNYLMTAARSGLGLP